MTQGDKTSGRIIRLTGGFYTVDTPLGVIETRARGLFRLEGTSPCVGDWAEVELTTPGEGSLVAIAPRRNLLVRPPVANLDQLMVVVAAAQPGPNFRVLDKLLTLAEHKDIPVIIVLTKTDLSAGEQIKEIYSLAGYPLIECGCDDMDSELINTFKDLLCGRLTALCGNTGVGKSSLLNRLCPELSLPTGEISKSLGRGKHTTRHVELYCVLGGFVADTPGFSSLELEKAGNIQKEELPLCFREFAPHIGDCRFPDCTHDREPGCGVQGAVEHGLISASRYESYIALLTDARKQNAWER